MTPSQCRGGGTGRRARLKIWWGQLRVGSIPTLGTLIIGSGKQGEYYE